MKLILINKEGNTCFEKEIDVDLLKDVSIIVHDKRQFMYSNFKPPYDSIIYLEVAGVLEI